MPRKKKSKSIDSLCANFMEISLDPSLLNNFATEQGLTSFINSISTSDEFHFLRAELIKELMNMIEECLTKRQKEIIKMTYIEGKTQNEISTALGKHQTAIHKAIQGNIDYTNDKKRYGGAIKKLKKLCARNKKIQDLLNKIRENNNIESRQ